MGNKATYFLDICGTLYHSNTTYDFLLWYHKRHYSGKYIFCRWMLSTPSKVLLVLFSKLGISWDVRSWLIGTLGKEEKELVVQEAKTFVAEYLEKKKNTRVHELMDQAKSEKSEIILVSASIYPVVSAISQALEISRFFATELEENHQRLLSGNVVNDVKGNKLKILEASGFDFAGETIIITDNKDDADLVKQCSKAVIVSKKKNISYWRKQLVQHPNHEIIHV